MSGGVFIGNNRRRIDNRYALLQSRVFRQLSADFHSAADQIEAEMRPMSRRLVYPVDHCGAAAITAHCVNRHSERCIQRAAFPYDKPRLSDRDDFASIIMAARAAQLVRALQFATIRAFLKRLDAQRIVRAAHVALRGRRFSFRNGHFKTLLSVEVNMSRGYCGYASIHRAPSTNRRYTDLT